MNWETIQSSFYTCFIEKDRYVQVLKGLGNTLIITSFALVLGVIIGLLLALIKVAGDNSKDQKLAPLFSIAKKDAKLFFQFVWAAVLRGLNWFVDLYLLVVRGIPLTIQLMIWFYVVLVFFKDPVPVAIVGFGINSGAYVCEIFRGGIMSINKGQMEAGRSLGLNYVQTMKSIILPQAFKNALPPLGNEFIALLKETSIVGYISGVDLTRAIYSIRNATYDSFTTLISAALIYLLLVMFMTWLLSLLERRLRAGDIR